MKIFIHRKDLRITDMPAWDYLAAYGESSLHLLILDERLLGDGRYLEHSGRSFLSQVGELIRLYEQQGQALQLYYGKPSLVLSALLENNPLINEIIVHEDSTPYARERDQACHKAATHYGVSFTSLADRSLVPVKKFHEWSGRESGYRVFTPYYKQWLHYLYLHPPVPYKVRISDLVIEGKRPLDERFALPEWLTSQLYGDSLATKSEQPLELLDEFIDSGDITKYEEKRDFYPLDTTSKLSSYLNSGQLGIRQVQERLIAAEQEENTQSWLRQLAWRDFYIYQSYMDEHFFSYEKYYDVSALEDTYYEAWMEGRTGIPIIDAAMCELRETGWLHNRLRMIVAMFLTKNLRCSFTLGEAYFRKMLADYDCIANRGGWLWSASLGFDSSPFFRVMNPVTQSIKWDESGDYIRRWQPQLAGKNNKQIHLPSQEAIVDLQQSRAHAIEIYKQILQKAKDKK